jgi:hypothetical protein
MEAIQVASSNPPSQGETIDFSVFVWYENLFAVFLPAGSFPLAGRENYNEGQENRVSQGRRRT